MLNKKLLSVKRKGILFIISAPSGSGKTTLCGKLVHSLEGLSRSISMTTRPPRHGEKDGIDYIFIDAEEFAARKKRGEFLEWARVFGEYYGTPARYVKHMLAKGQDVLLCIDVQGALKLKKLSMPKVYIYILPPSMSMLEDRLVKRSTDSRSEIKKRLAIAKKELAHLGKYDYAVVNNVIGSSIEELRSIVTAERCRVRRT